MNAPLLIRYSPPADTLMGDPVLVPLTVIELDSVGVDSATLVCAEKLNAFGTVSAEPVVTLNVPVTPPMFKVALLVSPNDVDERTRTVTV